MINPLFQQMVVNVAKQKLMPMTTDRQLTFNDLQILANQTSSMPETDASAINFFLNIFEKIAQMGDNNPNSISDQDIEAFSQQGIDLRA